MAIYRYKIAVKKRIGEHQCPYCSEVLHKSESLAGHIGGAHRKGITQKEHPQCKFCDEKLIPQVKGSAKGNWPVWAVKQRNLICIKCKRLQNRESYKKRMRKRSKR